MKDFETFVRWLNSAGITNRTDEADVLGILHKTVLVGSVKFYFNASTGHLDHAFDEAKGSMLLGTAK